MTDNTDMMATDVPEVKRESLDMTKHNFYTLLGIPVGCNISRIRAGFHKQCLRLHPDHFYPSYAMEVEDGGDDDDDDDAEEKEHPETKEARLRFESLAVGFAVLKDEERKRIYDTLGYEALLRSEEYQTESSLDVDPYEVYDDFWNGRDPKDKEYLFLNGPNVDWSDDEAAHEEEEEEDQEEEQHEEQQEEQMEDEATNTADGNTDAGMEETQETATPSNSSSSKNATNHTAAADTKPKQNQKPVSKKSAAKNMDVDEEHDEDELEDLAVLSAAMRNKSSQSTDAAAVSTRKHVIFEAMPRPPPHMAATAPISMLTTRPDRSDPMNNDVWKQLAPIATEKSSDEKESAESEEEDEEESDEESEEESDEEEEEESGEGED